MAITTMDGLLAGLSGGRRTSFYKVSQSAEGAATFHSLLKANGNPIAGATPTAGTGETPTKATVGAIPFSTPAGANKVYIGRLNMQGSTAGSLILYDRIWANSGLVGNVATSQAVDSIALSRNTDGENLEIFGEIYGAIGASAATLSITYTDAGNASRVGTYAHPANAESVGQMFQIVPPAGARGVKSIQSAIFSVTTGTAGTWGLTILRRLVEIPLPIINMAVNMNAFDLGLVELDANSCLMMMVMCTATNTGNIAGAIDIIEG
jgi:hypothetical protein